MTLVTAAWVSEPATDGDKITVIRAHLTSVGRAMFEAELEVAGSEGHAAVVAAWYDTMRVVTQPGFAADQQRIAELHAEAPRLTPADLRAIIDSSYKERDASL